MDDLTTDDTVDAVIHLAIELGTDRPDVTTVAVELVNFAQTNHELLRAARSALIERLHQQSADLDATRALRVVEEALRTLPYHRAIDAGAPMNGPRHPIARPVTQ